MIIHEKVCLNGGGGGVKCSKNLQYKVTFFTDQRAPHPLSLLKKILGPCCWDCQYLNFK